MALITLPIVSYSIRTKSTGMSSSCGGAGASPTDLQLLSYSRQAYRDSEFAIKVKLGVRPMMMPFRLTKQFNLQVPAPRPSGSSFVFMDACFGPPSDGGLRAELEALALYEANRKFYEKLQKKDSFNLGVALAEFKQTAGLIASTAVRLNSVFKHLRKGRVYSAFDTLGIPRSQKLDGSLISVFTGRSVRTAGQHAKELIARARLGTYTASQAWLELQYGWTPLLLDIYGGAEYVAKLLNSTNNDVYIKVRDEVEGERLTLNINGNSFAHVIASAKWAVGLKIVDAKLRNLSALGLTNPANILWEKMPFSFVVDWFYPVGAFLESITLMQGYSINEKSLTTCVELETNRITPLGHYLVKPGFVASSSRRYFDLKRVTNLTPSIVKPKFDVFDAIGGKRMASALSLLRTGFSHRI